MYVKVKCKKVNLYSTSLCPVSKELRYGRCVTRGSHSFICHPHANNTCCLHVQHTGLKQYKHFWNRQTSARITIK